MPALDDPVLLATLAIRRSVSDLAQEPDPKVRDAWAVYAAAGSLGLARLAAGGPGCRCAVVRAVLVLAWRAGRLSR